LGRSNAICLVLLTRLWHMLRSPPATDHPMFDHATISVGLQSLHKNSTTPGVSQ